MDSNTFREENEIGRGFEKAASSATTSSSTMRAYDVFINHRGIDTKHTIASTIYHTLDCMGLRVFLDKEELQLGNFIPETIEDAMRSASLHIAIFSKNYVQSPWCLAELSFMLKTGTKIIPIFVMSNLMNSDGSGVETQSMLDHSQNMWKVADTAPFSSSSGRVLCTMFHCIVDGSSTGLISKNIPLKVAKHPVGLDETVADFEKAKFQCFESKENVNIVGIVGKGGCGKTTLAKDLYSRKAPFFQRSSFLFDVRDAAAKNMLGNLQKKLLEDLLCVGGLTIDRSSEAKTRLAYRLRSIRVLIVLDNIDHIDQIDALLPAKDKFGEGSLIIVTTRYMNVLSCSGITSTYKMRGLDQSHAKEIFCWHAFLQSDPTPGFEDLVEQFLNACNGLPLSLKVLGGQLYGKSKLYWKSQLQKISTILPGNITQKLKVSYDALNEQEQEIFLDIACFFIGEKKELGITIWDASGWSGLHSLETLVNKSLVELDHWSRIRMHDYLRDLGREIAAKRTPCRLWFQFQKQRKERPPIRGIMAATTGFADFEGYPYCISHCPPPLNDCMELLMGNKSNTTSSLGLQLLVVKGNCFNQQFAELSRDLLWIRWFDFQYKKLPNWLSLRKLHVLELYNAGALEDLWMPDREVPFPELRELIITSSQHKFILQSFPTSVGSLGHLKKLALLGGFNSGEFKIRGLPEEFSKLQSLEHLELRHCTILASLPIGFGDLTNLRHLDLSFCKQLTTLPVSFRQLTQLQYLDLSVCLNLTLNNDILDNITKLEILKFTFCHKLLELPHQLTNQANLRELFLDGISIRELPADIDKLSRLEVLKIGSPFLENLPMSLGNLPCLTRLTIDHCPELKYLPESLGHLNHLEYLKLGWSGVEYLPGGVGQLSNLQTLELINTPIRNLPLANRKVHYQNRRVLNKVDPSICKLARLRRLRKITLWATWVTSISISKECCPGLETLEIVENQDLEEIITLPVTVKIMRLNACNSLKNIEGIGSLVNLEKLMICHCPELDGLPSLENLISLKELEIEVSSQVNIIQGFEHLRSLEMLTLTTAWNQPGIRSLEGTDKLKKLQLVANTRSALETCIGTIQRWPCEMTIAGRAVQDVDSIVSSFAFPNLNVVDKLTLVEDASMAQKGWWMLQFPETCLGNAAAIILSFVVHCHQDTSFSLSVHRMFDRLSGSSRSSIRLRQGKWLYISVFADSSLLMEDLKNSFADAIVVGHKPEKIYDREGNGGNNK